MASDSALDVLINNAGVLPRERSHTDEGFELTFATNVLGPFLLTELLLPKLRKSPAGRVVMMSSGGMYSSGFDLSDPQLENREYDGTKFYAQTKRAEVMLADEWQDRAGPGDPVFCSMHPGWAETAGVSDALPAFNKVHGAGSEDGRRRRRDRRLAGWRQPRGGPGRRVLHGPQAATQAPHSRNQGVGRRSPQALRTLPRALRPRARLTRQSTTGRTR